MLDIRPTSLADVIEIRPKRHCDGRGFFSETWSRRSMAEAGLDHRFVQDNHSVSNGRGVLRGLHFQVLPAVQVKLVRVSRGRIFDVAVDIRPSSPTYKKWVGVELSAADWNQLLIPGGFAHGFLTLEDHCEVQYKVSTPYSPDCDRGIRWNDPDIGIDWPIDGSPILSEKDERAPLLREQETGF